MEDIHGGYNHRVFLNENLEENLEGFWLSVSRGVGVAQEDQGKSCGYRMSMVFKTHLNQLSSSSYSKATNFFHPLGVVLGPHSYRNCRNHANSAYVVHKEGVLLTPASYPSCSLALLIQL